MLRTDLVIIDLVIIGALNRLNNLLFSVASNRQRTETYLDQPLSFSYLQITDLAALAAAVLLLQRNSLFNRLCIKVCRN